MNSRLSLNQVREAKELSQGRCLKEEKHWKVQRAEKLNAAPEAAVHQGGSAEKIQGAKNQWG